MALARSRRKEVLKKSCKKCGASLPLADFYSNRDWTSEYLKDAWCRKCVVAHCVDQESVFEYCSLNKRVFRQELWDWVLARAEKVLAEDEAHNKISDMQKRRDIYWKRVFSLFYQGMNKIQYYKFSNELTEGEIEELRQERIDNPNANAGLELDYGKKKYSKTWCGFYTEGELSNLEEYFHGLQRDFKLENSAYLDYARKVCKASLAMDKAFSDMCENKMGSEKRYKDFKDIFDQLSQSAKFAEKTRSENDSVGFGSLGEIIKKMENTGFLQTPIIFPKDDVDKIIDDYRWIITSVGEEF